MVQGVFFFLFWSTEKTRICLQPKAGSSREERTEARKRNKGSSLHGQSGVREGHRARCPGATEVSRASARLQGVKSPPHSLHPSLEANCMIGCFAKCVWCPRASPRKAGSFLTSKALLILARLYSTFGVTAWVAVLCEAMWA